MAFEGLTEKLNATFKRLRGKGRLSENDVREAMREVRLALLEADVSYKVVKEFVANVTERAVGSDVLDSLTPAQQVIKIVNEELTKLMGGGTAKIAMAGSAALYMEAMRLMAERKRIRCKTPFSRRRKRSPARAAVRANAVPKIPVPMIPILFISFPRCRCCLLTLILYAAGLNTSKYFI